MIDDETKEYLLFGSMLSSLILGGIGIVTGLLLLAYAVYLMSVALSLVSVFVLVLSTFIAAMAYTWFLNA